MEEPAVTLAGWVLGNFPYAPPLSHLKLQKLVFYGYGMLLAQDLEPEFGPALVFEPWKHGPVNRAVWHQYRDQGSAPLRAEPPTALYPSRVESALRDALAVYGLLNPWQLCEQSHLEAPWQQAYELQARQIDPAFLKLHFKRKCLPDQVTPPELLLDTMGFSLDQLPPPRYPSFHEMAERLGRNARRDRGGL